MLLGVKRAPPRLCLRRGRTGATDRVVGPTGEDGTPRGHPVSYHPPPPVKPPAWELVVPQERRHVEDVARHVEAARLDARRARGLERVAATAPARGAAEAGRDHRHLDLVLE